MSTEWHTFISGCFGERDLSFAVHPRDEVRAFDLLKKLRELNVGWRETRNAFEMFLSSKIKEPDHIATKLKKVEERYRLWLLD